MAGGLNPAGPADEKIQLIADEVTNDISNLDVLMIILSSIIHGLIIMVVVSVQRSGGRQTG